MRNRKHLAHSRSQSLRSVRSAVGSSGSGISHNRQSRSQRLHSFWSAPRMQDLWDNQCQNADESKSDWLLKFTGSLRVRSFKTGNEKCLAMFLLDVFDHARDGQWERNQKMGDAN